MKDECVRDKKGECVPEYIAKARDRIEINVKTSDESFMVEKLGTTLRQAGWHKAADKRNPDDNSYTMYWLVGP
jgi:hypothetical protein